MRLEMKHWVISTHELQRSTCHAYVDLFQTITTVCSLVASKIQMLWKIQTSSPTKVLPRKFSSQVTTVCILPLAKLWAEEKRRRNHWVYRCYKLQLTLELKHPGRWYPASGRMQMPRYKICFLYSSLLGLYLVTVYRGKIYFLCLSLKFKSQSNVYKHYTLSVIAVVQYHWSEFRSATVCINMSHKNTSNNTFPNKHLRIFF